ncbi:MAG: redoxin domain-containing protein [Verrucomicrobiota bacterium]
MPIISRMGIGERCSGFGDATKLFLAMAALFTVLCAAQAKEAVGDSAPAFHPGLWVQGAPVAELDGDHVYVVEFWATWCGPCRASIPHLNSLWQTFKDKSVVAIGQDVWDKDEAVAPFVQKMSVNMTYRVTLDDKSSDAGGFMASHWWKRGVEHHGIPHAFVIKNRRIAWIGNPMDLSDNMLDSILSPQFDFVKAAADYHKEQDEVERQWYLHDKRFQSEDFDFDLRLQIALQQNNSAARQLAEDFAGKHPSDAERLNALAWRVATRKGVENGNLPLAKELAERAKQVANSENYNILDTLARIQFLSGEKATAIATEQKALELAPTDRTGQLKKILAAYQADHLPDAQ